MKTFTANMILNDPLILHREGDININGFLVEKNIHVDNNQRETCLLKYNGRVLHGIKLATDNIDDVRKAFDIVEDKLKNMVLSAKLCQYCGEETYFDENDQMYKCDDCNASVGVHKQSNKKAFGSVANEDLKKWRSVTHDFFDDLWKYSFEKGIEEKPFRGSTDEVSRNWRTKCRMTAYKWLALKMDINNDFCHIAMFDITQCVEAINITRKYCDKYDAYYEEVREMVKSGEIKTNKEYSYEHIHI